MGNVFFWGWEIDFIVWLQTFANEFTTLLARLFTMLGEEYALIFILGLVYWCIDKDLGRKLGLAMTGSMLGGTLIKGIALRRRPYMDNESVKCLRAPHEDGDIMSPKDQGFSFPSLHSTMAVSTYGTIARYTKKKFTLILAIGLPICIGLSRPFLGVHYPTDVLTGWALGAACVFLLGAIEKKFGYKIGFLIVLIVGLAGFFYCSDSEFFAAYGVTLGLLLGFMFEEKFVKFQHCRKWWSYIIRPVVGVVLFVLVGGLLKLPVLHIDLPSDNIIILACRFGRYLVSTFVTIGVYPFLFNLFKNKI